MPFLCPWYRILVPLRYGRLPLRRAPRSKTLNLRRPVDSIHLRIMETTRTARQDVLPFKFIERLRYLRLTDHGILKHRCVILLSRLHPKTLTCLEGAKITRKIASITREGMHIKRTTRSISLEDSLRSHEVGRVSGESFGTACMASNS